MKRSKKRAPEDWMRPIASAVRRHRIVTYDVESKDGASDRKGFSRPFLVGLYDGEHYTAFRTIDHVRTRERQLCRGGCVDLFMREVLSREDLALPNAVLYAHNGGRFDSTFVLTWLRRHLSDYQVAIVSAGAAAQSIEVRSRAESKKKRARVWRFVDSARILPMSLAEATATFCSDDAQKETTFDLDTEENVPGWERYNELDCVSLARALEAFRGHIEELGGELGVTAPSTSMRLFRRAFQRQAFYRARHFPSCDASRFVCESKTGACLHDWIRSGYHGGRVEIFRPIAAPGVRYYDLNSSYSCSMLEPMPVGPCREVGPEEWQYVHGKLAETHVGFVECTVSIPEDCYLPPLPVHHVKLDKLIFPVGTFSGVFAWSELELLPNVGGRIVEVKRSAWFEAERVFASFVETLYAFRDANRPGYTPALSVLAKNMLNFHYGKYGTKPEREKLVLIDPGKDRFPKDGKPLGGDHLHDDCWIVPSLIDAPYLIPQIAAQVTALSRVAVWRALHLALSFGGRIYYSDTDSILVAPPEELTGAAAEAWFDDFEAQLGLGKGLGQWKREHPSWVLAAQFAQPKSYMLEDTASEQTVVRLKGVVRSARTRENFEKLVAGQTVTFERVSQHRTVLANRGTGPELVTATKRIVASYDKRIECGGDTWPVVLPRPEFNFIRRKQSLFAMPTAGPRLEGAAYRAAAAARPAVESDLQAVFDLVWKGLYRKGGRLLEAFAEWCELHPTELVDLQAEHGERLTRRLLRSERRA